MLINNYKDKVVKIVVSSQSGAGISLGDMTRGGTLSTTITIIGKISAYAKRGNNSRLIYFWKELKWITKN